MPGLVHLHRLPQGDGPARRPRWPRAQPQRPRPLRHRLLPVHVLRYLHRGLSFRRPVLVSGVRVRRDRHPRAHPRARQAPRVDVDRPGPARPGPRRGGAQGDRRRPQDRREAGRRPSGTAGSGGGVVSLAPSLSVAAAAQHGFLSPAGVEIAFLLVGLATFGAALVTVTTRQLVHAALWLVVALGGLAVEYLLLTAEFIAWVQVLIYVGSVVVLLLFGLMLTKAPIGRSPDADSGNRWAALTVAVAAAAALIWVVVDAFRTTWIDLDGPAAGSTEATGASLFQNWVLPFEALSVLLLAALVGAIVLSRKAKAESSSPPLNSRAATGSSPSD